jgi:hypothetical protein
MELTSIIADISATEGPGSVFFSMRQHHQLSRFQTQTILRRDRFAGPERAGGCFEVDSVPFGIKMRQHQFSWLGDLRDVHRFRQFRWFGVGFSR